eukprot:COSAG06_NODE_3452_length_5322_cov_3.171357_7_plen_173_part_00
MTVRSPDTRQREKNTPSMLNAVNTMTENTQHGYVYGILNSQGRFIYAGSSLVLAPGDRMSKHRGSSTENAGSPLHRAMQATDDSDLWQLIVLEAMPEGTTRQQLRNREQVHLTQLRTAGHPLLNRNDAVCQSERVRLSQQAWRAAHPGYMAEAGRRYRARQRALREAPIGEQ